MSLPTESEIIARAGRLDPDEHDHAPECPAARYKWEACGCKRIERDAREYAASLKNDR